MRDMFTIRSFLCECLGYNTVAIIEIKETGGSTFFSFKLNEFSKNISYHQRL